MGGCASDELDPRESKDLAEILATARTGDIILFSGRGFFSDVVRVASESKWSHVGIVIRLSKELQPLLFQSTKDLEPWDIQSNRYKEGPKISSLSMSIKTYDGYTIAYRKLHSGKKGKESTELRSKWTSTLWEFQASVNDKPYETNIEELAASAFGISEGNDRSAYFCTEIVADSLVKMNLLDLDTLVNGYTIDNFSSDSPIILRDGAFYDPEIYVRNYS